MIFTDRPLINNLMATLKHPKTPPGNAQTQGSTKREANECYGCYRFTGKPVICNLLHDSYFYYSPV
jgi:hypothetical protein